MAGFGYATYEKSDNRAPKTLPTFVANVPDSLRDLYVSYQEVDLDTNMGGISIRPYGNKLSESELGRLLPRHPELTSDTLSWLCTRAKVVYHTSSLELFLLTDEDRSLAKLNLSIEAFLNWLIVFLGIGDFPLLFVANPEANQDQFERINQDLNAAFFAEDFLPDWFQEQLPPSLKVHSPLQIGDRVKDLRSGLSGKIAGIKGTKAILEMDCGGTTETLSRLIVQTSDNIYERLFLGQMNLLELSEADFHSLSNNSFSREFRTMPDFAHLNDLHSIKALYQGHELRAVFGAGLSVLQKIRQKLNYEITYNEAESWKFTQNLVLSGMFFTCYLHLLTHQDSSLTVALGEKLSIELKEAIEEEEKMDKTNKHS